MSLKVLFGVEDGFGSNLSGFINGTESHPRVEERLIGFIKVASWLQFTLSALV